MKSMMAVSRLGRVCRPMMLGLAMLALAPMALADSYWNGKNAGNLDDAANWTPTPAADSTAGFYVTNRLSGPLTISQQNASFFGGAMLRYKGAKCVVTNDFGAGYALTNLGAAAGSSFHVEGGAKVVHKSGRLVCYKGTQYDGTYLTGNSTLQLDGPDAVFEQVRGKVSLRSNSKSATAAEHTYLIITNGAVMKLHPDGDSMFVGANYAASAGHVVVAGSGSQLIVGTTVVTGGPKGKPAATNSIDVLDGGRLYAQELIVGNSRSGDLFRAAGADTFCSVTNAYFMRSADARITDGARFEAKTMQVGTNENDNARLEISNGACVQNVSTTLVAEAATLVVNNAELKAIQGPIIVSVYSEGMYVTNSALSVVSSNTVSYFNNRIVFKDCPAVSLPKVQLNSKNSSLRIEDSAVTAFRLEMDAENTSIHLINADLTLPYGKEAACIFMLGDGSGGDLKNNGYRRDVYVGGTNTYVKANGRDHGLYVRGSNTTFHVDIPAQGFSTAHPVFEFRKMTFNKDYRLRVEITSAEELSENGGGTYTLFSGENAASDQVDYVYDPNRIKVTKRIFKSEGYSEVYVKVRRSAGTAVLVR